MHGPKGPRRPKPPPPKKVRKRRGFAKEEARLGQARGEKKASSRKRDVKKTKTKKKKSAKKDLVQGAWNVEKFSRWGKARPGGGIEIRQSLC